MLSQDDVKIPSVVSSSSNSSVNKEWENWVLLHGNAEVAVDDVWGIKQLV